MNRKQYLISLVEKRTNDIGDLKNKIIDQIDLFSDKQIEKLIGSFERSKERRKRIAAGEAHAVLEELKTEKAKRKQKEKANQMKALKEREEKQTSHDEMEAEALLQELEDITDNNDKK